MPLPTPSKNEEKNAFVSRCVSSLSNKDEFGSNSQRVAVCISQWKRHKKKELLSTALNLVLKGLGNG